MNFKDQLKDVVSLHQQNLLKIQERVKELEGFPEENLEFTLNGGQESEKSLDKYNYSGVYAIFAVNPSRVPEIVKNLVAFRGLEKREHCVPGPSRNAKDEGSNGCLYVGKSLTSLNNRLKNHLSNPENKYKTTFALKMNLWLKQPEQLRIHFVRIDVNDANDEVLILECENALRNYFRPAIGE